MTDKPITKAQIQSIHVAISRQGLDDATYRDKLRLMFGVETCKALTRVQATTLLKSLGRPLRAVKKKKTAKKAAKRTTRRVAAPVIAITRNASNVIALASPAQHALIAELVSEIEWREAGGYDAWRVANLGLRRIRTSAEAAKVIEGLKGLKSHGSASHQ